MAIFLLSKLLSLVYILSFISYPASMVLMAKERINEMNVIATIQPAIYWIGILSTYSFFELMSFALFKLIAILASETYYLHSLIKYLNMPMKFYFNKVIYPLILPLAFLVSVFVIVYGYLPYEKSRVNLLIVVGTTGFGIVGAFIIQYLTSSDLRKITKQFINASVGEDYFCYHKLRKMLISVISGF